MICFSVPPTYPPLEHTFDLCFDDAKCTCVCPDLYHIVTRFATISLAQLCKTTGDLERAIDLFEQCCTVQETVYGGKEFVGYLEALENLADAYHASGQTDKSGPLFAESEALRSKLLPQSPFHRLSLSSVVTPRSSATHPSPAIASRVPSKPLITSPLARTKVVAASDSSPAARDPGSEPPESE